MGATLGLEISLSTPTRRAFADLYYFCKTSLCARVSVMAKPGLKTCSWAYVCMCFGFNFLKLNGLGISDLTLDVWKLKLHIWVSQGKETSTSQSRPSILKIEGKWTLLTFPRLMLVLNPITVPGTIASATCDVFANAFLLQLSESLCEKFLPALIFQMQKARYLLQAFLDLAWRSYFQHPCFPKALTRNLSG